jgi:hypothetical protein
MGAIVTDSLRRNLPQLQGMRIEPRTHDLAEVKMVFGCNGDDRAECMTKVGRNLEVSRLIYGSIRKQGANLRGARLGSSMCPTGQSRKR